MKKTLLALIALFACSFFLLCSCNPEPEPDPHVHTFADEWSYDSVNHWLAATCEHTDEVKDFAPHSFGPETDLGNGVTSKTCKLCGYNLVSKPGCTVLLTLQPNNGENPIYLAGNEGQTIVLPSPKKTAVGISENSLRASTEYDLAFWRSPSGEIYEAGSSYTFTSANASLEAVYSVHVAVVRGDASAALADFFNGTLDYTTFKISYVSPFMSDSDIVGVFSAKPDSALTVPSSLVANGYSLFDLDENFIDLSSKTGSEDMILISLPDVVAVSFDPNSAGGEAVVKNVPYGKVIALPANLFEKTGSEFNGWNTSATGEGTAYSDSASFTADTTLYAQWLQFHTVTFDANGGEGAMDALQGVDERVDVTLPAATFTKSGYAFNGWNTASDGTGIAFPDAFTGRITFDATLYAQWIRTYTIQYDANGGSGTMEASIARDGETLSLPAATFTRPGYVFNLWCTKADGTGPTHPDLSKVKFTADTTLYAQWLQLHTVIFDANGGEGTMQSLVGLDERVDATLPAATFTREGYVFKEWNTKADGSGISYIDQHLGKFTSDLTLYAQWQVFHTITYNANGAEGTMDASIVLETDQFALPSCAFTKTGYLCKGWNTASDGSGTSYSIDYKGSFTADTTLYAQWTKVGTTGQAGGVIFYDCDEDNASGNADGLVSTECGWRFLEAVLDPNETAPFCYYRFEEAGDNLYVNATINYTEDCTGTAIGTGANNTKKLVERMQTTAYKKGDAPETTSNYAAKHAYDFVLGDYDDWFLPSKDELNAIARNLKAVGKPLLGDHWYWSSSECDISPTLAWNMKGSTFMQSTDERDYSFYICFARSFI